MFTSHSTANLLTVIADIIAKVLNTSDTTHAVVLDNQRFLTGSEILVFFTNLSYKTL